MLAERLLFSAGQSSGPSVTFNNNITSVDPFFNDVTMLLSLNNNLTDSSGMGFSLTNNNVSFSNSNPKFSGTYTASFNGTSSSVTCTTTATTAFAFKFGGDFTFDAWVYLTNNTNISTIFDQSLSTTSAYGWTLNVNTSGQLCFYTDGGTQITSSTSIPLNTWTHVAVGRASESVWLWINGNMVGWALTTSMTGTASGVFNFSDGGFSLGTQKGGANYWTGNMSNVRITNGICRYTGNFIVPTTPYVSTVETADPFSSVVAQLMHFDGDFTDSGTYAIPSSSWANTGITFPGTSKFGSSSAYCASASTYAYLNNTAISPVPVDGDFTLEFWVMFPALPGASTLICFNNNNGFPIAACDLTTTSTNKFNFQVNGGANITGTTTITASSWYHVALTRVGLGNGAPAACSTFYLFVNGNLEAASGPGSYNNFGGSLYFNINGIANSGTLTGGTNMYLDELRLTMAPRYISKFSAPTSAFSLTAPSSYDPFWQKTTFLMIADSNNSLADWSVNNMTIGNNGVTTSNTSTKQYSYYSVFSNSSTYLSPTSSQVNLPTQFYNSDFTIEFWIKPTSLANQNIFDTRNAAGNTTGCYVALQAAGSITFGVGSGTSLISGGSISAGAWAHVAVVRNTIIQSTGQVAPLKLFINGALVSATTMNRTFSDTNFVIGNNLSHNGGFIGNIDGFRITKASRYLAPFTPPTTPFLRLGAI